MASDELTIGDTVFRSKGTGWTIEVFHGPGHPALAGSGRTVGSVPYHVLYRKPGEDMFMCARRYIDGLPDGTRPT